MARAVIICCGFLRDTRVRKSTDIMSSSSDEETETRNPKFKVEKASKSSEKVKKDSRKVVKTKKKKVGAKASVSKDPPTKSASEPRLSPAEEAESDTQDDRKVPEEFAHIVRPPTIKYGSKPLERRDFREKRCVPIVPKGCDSETEESIYFLDSDSSLVVKYTDWISGILARCQDLPGDVRRDLESLAFKTNQDGGVCPFLRCGGKVLGNKLCWLRHVEENHLPKRWIYTCGIRNKNTGIQCTNKQLRVVSVVRHMMWTHNIRQTHASMRCYNNAHKFVTLVDNKEFDSFDRTSAVPRKRIPSESLASMRKKNHIDMPVDFCELAPIVDDEISDDLLELEKSDVKTIRLLSQTEMAITKAHTMFAQCVKAVHDDFTKFSASTRHSKEISDEKAAITDEMLGYKLQIELHGHTQKQLEDELRDSQAEVRRLNIVLEQQKELVSTKDEEIRRLKASKDEDPDSDNDFPGFTREQAASIRAMMRKS